MPIIIPVNIPNAELLTMPWPKIMDFINGAKTKKRAIKRILELAQAYGEINRLYSKKLPDPIFCVLQKRMTEIERIARYIIKTDQNLKITAKEFLGAIRKKFSGEGFTNIRRVF